MVELVPSYSVETRTTGTDSTLPGVVFLPGLFAGAWIWDGVWERLPPAVPAVRVVEPMALLDGRQVHSIEKSTAAVEQAIATTSLRRFVVCGNSLGALLAVDFALRHPDRVAGVVVSGGPGVGPETPLALRPRYTKEFFSSLMSHVFVDPSRVDRDRMEEIFHVMKGHRQLSNIVGGLRTARKYPMNNALRRLTCPALFVWGEQDRVTPPAAWVKIVRTALGVEVNVVPDAGHSPMIEQPEAFSRLFNSFYDDVAQHENAAIGSNQR